MKPFTAVEMAILASLQWFNYLKILGQIEVKVEYEEVADQTFTAFWADHGHGICMAITNEHDLYDVQSDVIAKALEGFAQEIDAGTGLAVHIMHMYRPKRRMAEYEEKNLRKEIQDWFDQALVAAILTEAEKQ
jgi:hypothetical protein